MKLDRNYSIKKDTANIYSDSFDEIVDLVVQARSEGKITLEESMAILNFAMKKQNQKEIRSFFTTFLFGNQNAAEKHTLLIQVTTKNTQYA